MAILASPTRLPNKLAFRLNRFANRFSVRDLGLADVRLDRKFTTHPINNNIQMQLAHATNNNLTRILIRADAK